MLNVWLPKKLGCCRSKSDSQAYHFHSALENNQGCFRENLLEIYLELVRLFSFSYFEGTAQGNSSQISGNVYGSSCTNICTGTQASAEVGTNVSSHACVGRAFRFCFWNSSFYSALPGKYFSSFFTFAPFTFFTLFALVTGFFILIFFVKKFINTLSSFFLIFLTLYIRSSCTTK